MLDDFPLEPRLKSVEQFALVSRTQALLTPYPNRSNSQFHVCAQIRRSATNTPVTSEHDEVSTRDHPHPSNIRCAQRYFCEGRMAGEENIISALVTEQLAESQQVLVGEVHKAS